MPSITISAGKTIAASFALLVIRPSVFTPSFLLQERLAMLIAHADAPA
jgi:hypothetical protein